MEYEVDYEEQCSKCFCSPLHNRDCINCATEGYTEEFEDDLQIEGLGREVVCIECRGTGVEWWCPNCGENMSGKMSGSSGD